MNYSAELRQNAKAMYTADYLIGKRREKWDELHDIEYDRELRGAIADELLSGGELLSEVRANPEKLIELLFVVVDKDKKTMPFFFNEIQRDFIDKLNKAIEDFNAGLIPEISLVIIKGRQQGFTTLITAYQLACALLNRNFEGYTLADKSDNVEAIFQNKAKFTYSQLPDCIKPTERFNNRKMLLFEKLNSSWSVDTASKDVARSRTINFFHGSECAFWKDGIAPTQASIGEALTKNCIKIYESTANGYNDYEKMCRSGAHIVCFYEWWRTAEYYIPFPSEELKLEFLHNIDVKKEWIWGRLLWLRDSKQLLPEQLYWYYNKYEKYIDKDLIKQEYPCTLEEAFLLPGAVAFDTEAIIARLLTVPRPIKVGYFKYDYDGLAIKNIQWVSDRAGYIRIFALPNSPEFTKYCIGGDTAGDGSDNFTGHVLDAKTGREVAVIEHKFDADQYTRQMYCLGKYYSDALIGIEANYDSFPIRELTRLGYDNQYVREVPDTYTGKTVKKFGFKTDSVTRPVLISHLKEIVRDHTHLISDRATLDELLTIIKNKEGRVEAPVGGHDDHMMGLGIAHEIRGQVTFDSTVTYVSPQYHFTEERKSEVQYDYGEEITII